MTGMDYSVEARRERRFERDRELAKERELWRAQYFIRQGSHVAISREASDDDLDRMALAMMDVCNGSWSWVDVARAAHAALVRTDG